MHLRNPKFLGGLVAASTLVVWGSVWGIATAPHLTEQQCSAEELGSQENCAESLRSRTAVAESVGVVFGGDVMLDRNVAAWHGEEPEALFAGVADVFKDADLRVANLEGTITTNPSIARRDSSILRFTFDPAFAQAALGPLGLDAVSLANNHAYDFGPEGYQLTKKYAESWGVATFGHPYDRPEFISTILTVRGKTVCLVGYHALYDADTSSAVEAITTLRGVCWRLVVFAHWGEEYKLVPEASTIQIAHSFIDAGADVVIGAHPHVVQPHEVYKGKAIFYSLGNFMFDQEFSPDVKQGLLVRARFGATQDCFTPIPTVILHGLVSALEPLDTFCLP